MRKLLVLSLIAFSNVSLSFGQVDTLYEENLRKVGDIVFEKLNQELYGPALMNRAFSSNPTTLSQYRGDYSQIHSIAGFFELYGDLSLAYTDSN